MCKSGLASSWLHPLCWLLCGLPCSEDSWEALLLLAAVSDAFDISGPEKAWETLQVCVLSHLTDTRK